MGLELRDNKDFLAGLLFIAIGLVAVAVARNYPFGTAMRMGSGYFPTVLGGILILLGAWVMGRGLRSGEKVESGWGGSRSRSSSSRSCCSDSSCRGSS